MIADGLPLPDWCVRLVRRKTCDCGERIILVRTSKDRVFPFHRKHDERKGPDEWIPHGTTCPYAQRYRRKPIENGAIE